MMHHQNWFEGNTQEAYKNGCQALGHRGMYYHNGGWIYMMGIGIIIILGVIFLVMYYFNSKDKDRGLRNNTSNKIDSAFDILDREFAAGNITEEEYLRKKELLKK